MKMSTQEAAKVLREHQAWRKGGDGPQTDVTLLTQAIDAAVAALESLSEPAAWLYTMPISGERIACASRKMLPNERPLFAAAQHPRERALSEANNDAEADGA